VGSKIGTTVYVYEHVHVNDHDHRFGFVPVDVHVDGFSIMVLYRCLSPQIELHL